MDEIDPRSSRLNYQTSSIPRPSKLPVPRSSTSGIPRPATSGLPLRQQRSQSSLKSSQSSRGVTGASPQFSSSVRGTHDTTRTTGRILDANVFKKPTSRPSSRDQDPGSTFLKLGGHADHQGELPSLKDLPKRRPRPSLSERTIESLSQVPPSPAKGRRTSGFNVPGSPMRPPSRSASAMSTGRPASALGSRPSSPIKPAGPPPVPRLPTAYTERPAAKESNTESKASLNRQGSLESSSRTIGRTSIRPSTSNGKNAQSSASATDRVKSSSMKAKATTKASVSAKRPMTRPSENSLQFQAQGGSGTGVTSSSALLRETIAKAKAAARVAATKSNIGTSSIYDGGSGDQLAKESRSLIGNTGLLRNRIKSGRMTGNLNIAALGLREIPDEVMKMYDFDPSLGSEWAEMVDLTKLIAADNELEELREDGFPDVSIEDLEQMEQDVNFQFGGLEIMDIHGNKLQRLPPGIRRLNRLHTLNLANNGFDVSSLSILFSLHALRDLNLSSNKLAGCIPGDISQLSNLQSLNLRGNRITELPASIGTLTQLKKLDISRNQLLLLPVDSIVRLPLVELNASGNRLNGCFLSTSNSLPYLVNLDISHNVLDEISSNATLQLPSLQTLHADGNRLTAVPELSQCTKLLTLTLSENMLMTFPNNMLSLQNLRILDLSRNNISRMDANVALMENLNALQLEGNPLRERKYLTMSTSDMKEDLRKRFNASEDMKDDTSTTNASGEAMREPTVTSSHSLPVMGNVLDMQSKGLIYLDVTAIPAGSIIKEARLRNNKFSVIPVSLLSFSAATLRILDLSGNPLSKSFLAQSISLPTLSVLKLSSTGLTSLEPLASFLDAPRLSELDISVNRLAGEFPTLRQVFPQLTTINAADNQYTTLSSPSALGLTSLNLQNNALSSLDPALGLLNKDLKMLEVRGNQFRVPRWDVLDKGTPTLMKWLRARIPEDQRREIQAQVGNNDDDDDDDDMF